MTDHIETDDNNTWWKAPRFLISTALDESFVHLFSSGVLNKFRIIHSHWAGRFVEFSINSVHGSFSSTAFFKT